jgi:hypothetical protein
MWTKLMKLAKDKIPKEGEDRGLEHGYEAPPVSGSVLQFFILCLLLRRVKLSPDSSCFDIL